MPAIPVDASKFAGISEEQARTFPARTVVGVELSDAQVAAMPQMISTDAHVMEPDALWQELTPRLRDHLPKVPFRNCPPGASDPRLRLRDQDTDGVAAEILFPNYGMALFGIETGAAAGCREALAAARQMSSTAPSGTPVGHSTTAGRLAEPLTLNSTVPGSSGTPTEANRRGPSSARTATCANVEALESRVGQSSTPCSAAIPLHVVTFFCTIGMCLVV